MHLLGYNGSIPRLTTKVRQDPDAQATHQA
jgi:hypothetical protein